MMYVNQNSTDVLHYYFFFFSTMFQELRKLIFCCESVLLVINESLVGAHCTCIQLSVVIRCSEANLHRRHINTF